MDWRGVLEIGTRLTALTTNLSPGHFPKPRSLSRKKDLNDNRDKKDLNDNKDKKDLNDNKDKKDPRTL
jgi:hypothetical protein